MYMTCERILRMENTMRVKNLIDGLNNGRFDESLKRIYGASQPVIEEQKQEDRLFRDLLVH